MIINIPINMGREVKSIYLEIESNETTKLTFYGNISIKIKLFDSLNLKKNYINSCIKVYKESYIFDNITPC